jgi:hypothetical protein
MRTSNLLLVGVLFLTATLSAMAAFTPPTDAQIKSAAENPALLAPLLKGASLEETAHVVKAVIARMGSLHLSNDVLTARVTEVVNACLAAVAEGGHDEFCRILGTEMGISEAIKSNPAIVSAVQGALAAHGAGEATAFGDAYEAAGGGSGNRQNTRDSNKVQPPAAGLYPGQN